MSLNFAKDVGHQNQMNFFWKRSWFDIKSKKVTRSIRIGLDVDDEIEKYQKTNDYESFTQSLLVLVRLGLQADKFKLELKMNPEKEMEYGKLYAQLLDRLTDEKQMSESFSKLKPNELVALKQMLIIEEDVRERKKLAEEKLEQERRQQENMRMYKLRNNSEFYWYMYVIHVYVCMSYICHTYVILQSIIRDYYLS